ncbi:hypothetical protein [Carnobacterium maltaromaticum]|uniref:hypothetical protein n=1 Tax=Carnobacterium maltaromaticum TaxID=2751 RepID=UPI00295EE1A1|nr:hypothetical protein [Carnobacterium maltaromaticum]
MKSEFSLILDVVTVVIAAVAIIYSWKNKHAAKSNEVANKYSSLSESHTIDDQIKEILSLHPDIHHRIGNFEATKSLFIINKKDESYENRIVAMKPLLNYIKIYTEKSENTLGNNAENIPYNSNYTEQSLGTWSISKDKMDSIKYLIGIELNSRIIVSIMKVKTPENYTDVNGNNKVRFSKDESILEWAYGKNVIRLDESILWNARNPIKYLN